MSGDQSYQFNQVRFALEADTQTIHIKQLRADTPWGETNLKLDVNTLKPFVLSGEVSLKQSTDNVPYDVLAQFSGDLHHLTFASKAMLSKQAGKFMIHQQNPQQLAPAALVALNGQLDLIGDYPLAVTANIDVYKRQSLWLSSLCRRKSMASMATITFILLVMARIATLCYFTLRHSLSLIHI